MEYHKIETLYERDPATFKVRVGEFKNRTYTIPKRWHFTEKVDGSNIRVEYVPARYTGVCGRVTFGGKSAEAQIHAQLLTRLQELFPVQKFIDLYSDIVSPHYMPDLQSMVVYGEGYGPGIQKGGGDYIDHKDFITFDVLINQKWWLSWENVNDVAGKLGLSVVPEVGLMTLEEATELVRSGFPTLVKTARTFGDEEAERRKGRRRMAEGLVGRTEEPLFDKKGARLIVKLKTKDF